MSTDLRTALEAARHSIFRLEALQVYAGSGEDEALAAFRTGGEPVRPRDKDAYTAMVRAAVGRGCTVQRVHVVTEPLSEYLQWELRYSYPLNVEAGEDVRIAVTATEPRIPDFWLLDDRLVFWPVHGVGGVLRGHQVTTDPTGLSGARYWRDATLRIAVPWAEYMQRAETLRAS
jgi:hypothetical protein